jgi:hypothetical protein
MVWKTALGNFRRVQGQVTTEWLMIAGVLTACGLIFVRTVPDLMRLVVRGLAAGIRTVAP